MPDAVVSSLLAVQPGDEINLTAEHYDWSTPFTVRETDDVTFQTPGDDWQARSLTLDPTYNSGTSHTITAVEGCPPPTVGSRYGQLTEVAIVDGGDYEPDAEGATDDADDEGSDRATLTRERIEAALDDADSVGEVADTLGVEPSTALYHIGKHDLEGRIRNMTSSGEVQSDA